MGILLASLAGVTLAGCDSQASDTEDTKDVAHIRIAAAANMSDVLPPIIEAYQQRQAQADIAVTDIDVTYASSGKLYAQIEAGAPYDVFLSANQDFPAKLAATHVGTAPFSYTRGQLALYSITQPLGAPTANTVPALYRTTTPLKITLANGKLAPYGAAAAHYLQQASQGASLPKNVQTIQAENIGQAFQYTHSGSVDYGFVALSQLVATKTPKSAYTVLPVAGYPALLQDGIVLSDKPAAQGFARHLQSAEAQDILTRSGYLPVSDAQ
ncbi:molybdate ABC transporter substrate-binding protein [Psychrobacter aestuarii]|uniref:molybdate ABC transporter substrate-binding protein n=1 Tax=Psychrobacter aestuarii TaxID=556327 RepID=UPI001919B8C7|nr:molybdate ABC transporter substrate-binding protein [Psychrobacter aestuarii]